MSKRTEHSYDDLYSNIELVPDDLQTENSQHISSSDSSESSHNVITDKEDSHGFDVDWDTIEENYHRSHRHHHSRHGSHHSSGSHSHHNTHHSSGSHSHHDTHHSSESHSSDSDKKSKNGKSKKSPKKKWSVTKKILVGILLFLLCLIIGIAAALLIMRHNGKRELLNYDNLNVKVPEEHDYEDGGRFVYYKGDKYEFNTRIATILFMGIDKEALEKSSTIGIGGQADALYLFTYDTSNGKIKVLCLNRDTMTDISRYDENGVYYDTSNAQLCLAYAYGDGKKLSAENQVTAVERLLYNVPINAYYAIDLSALKILNDDIGGVTLTPQYTFKSFTKGQKVTIKGDMAEEFVRYRDFTLLDDNLRRMACQRQYINAFARQIVPAIRKNYRVPMKLYEDTSKYTVTNIGASDLTYLASTLTFNYSGLELITTPGEYHDVADDEFAEFKVDKTKLFETVLSIFYTKVN